MDEFIVKYQDPKEADKLMKLEHTLKEVTDIVHKNMEDVNKKKNEFYILKKKEFKLLNSF